MIAQRCHWRTGAMAVALILMPLSPLPAQTVKTLTLGGDDADAVHQIAELGALILEKDSTLEVGDIMPKEQRPADYRDVDLQQEDIIMMVNGKRTLTVADLTGILDSLAPGDEIEMGIRRDKEMRLVSFAKADPKDLPQMKTMTMGGPGGDNEDLAILMGSGIVAKQDGDSVVVAMLMPDFKDATGAADVKEGDRILTLQEEKILSTADLQESFDAISVGDKVRLTLERDGEQHAVSFKKAAPGGKVMKRGTKETKTCTPASRG